MRNCIHLTTTLILTSCNLNAFHIIVKINTSGTGSTSKRIDISLYETVFGPRGLGDAKFGSSCDALPLTPPQSSLPIRTALPAGPTFVESVDFAVNFREHRDASWDHDILTAGRTHYTMGKRVKESIRDPAMSRGHRVAAMLKM